MYIKQSTKQYMYIKQSTKQWYTAKYRNNMGNQSYVNICHVYRQIQKNIMYTVKYRKIIDSIYPKK